MEWENNTHAIKVWQYEDNIEFNIFSAKEMKFFKIEAFCGAKPNELNEHDAE